jgi:glyoxylase-like metal-dependent hydrolase (beta-lactamase superfamily II)
MGIRVTHLPFSDANHMNAYVVWCPASRQGILVDPGSFDGRIEEMVESEQLELTGILVTHSHWDHIGGLEKALEMFDIPVIASKETLARKAGQAKKTQVVAEGDTIDIGGHTGKVFEVPGHIDDQITVYVDGHLLGGDTLFAAALGGTPDEPAFHTQAGLLRRILFHLPTDTVVHSGHGPVTEVGLERIFNPFLKGIEPKWKSAPGSW